MLSTDITSPAVGGNVHDGYWKYWAPSFQNQQPCSVQSYGQTSLDISSSYENLCTQQSSSGPQGPSTQYQASYQMPYSYQSSLPTVQQNVASADMGSATKLQIPINPRITSTLTTGLPKLDMQISTANTEAKPAYVSVSLPKTIEKVNCFVLFMKFSFNCSWLFVTKQSGKPWYFIQLEY